MEPQKESTSVALSKEFNIPESQLTTIINTIAKGATVSELKLFLYIAQKTKLDPFTRQIHFVKRKSKQPDGSYKETGTVQTGIDGYRAIAERTASLGGIEDAVYDSEENKYPKKATVTVYRIIANGEKVAFTASARWDEYCQRNFKTNEPVGLWAKMPYLMLGKCAEALALRKAFPNDLSGIYTHEEMSQADYEQPVVSVIEPVKKPTPAKVTVQKEKALEVELLTPNVKASSTSGGENPPSGAPEELKPMKTGKWTTHQSEVIVSRPGWKLEQRPVVGNDGQSFISCSLISQSGVRGYISQNLCEFLSDKLDENKVGVAVKSSNTTQNAA